MNLFLPSSSRCRRRYPTCFKTAPVTSWKIRKAQLVSKLWLTRGNLSHVFIYIKGMNMKVWKEKEGLKIYLKYDYNLLYPNVDDLPKITASVCSLSKKCASTLISHNIKTTCLMLCTFSWCLQSNCAPLRHYVRFSCKLRGLHMMMMMMMMDQTPLSDAWLIWSFCGVGKQSKHLVLMLL